jgi:ankyrin repeat protein
MKTESSKTIHAPPPKSFIESLFTACKSGDFDDFVSLLSATKYDARNYRNATLQDLLDVAIENNRLSICKYLMESGFDLHERVQSSLIASVETRDVETVKFIASCVPDDESLELDDAFEHACANGFVDIVEMFLATYPQFDLQIALYAACLEGHVPVIKVLLDAGANPNDIIQRFRRAFCLPLHAAISRGHQDTIDFLLQSGANLLTGTEQRGGMFALTVSAYESLFRSLAVGGNVALMQEALSAINDHEDPVIGRTFVIAAKAGNTAMVQAMLSSSALRPEALSPRLGEALRVAMAAGHEETAQTLIDAGACSTEDFNRDDLLMAAAEGGCAGIVSQLLASGARVDGSDLFITPLSKASAPAVVRVLLDAKAAVNRENATPVLLASCRESQPESVRMLLEAKAPVLAPTSKSDSCPLLEALSPIQHQNLEGKLAVLSLLLDAGADIRNAAAGCTAMHVCGMTSGEDMVATAALVLDRDPTQLDFANRSGMTPLALAAKDGFVDMVRFLIARGANVNARDNAGLSVLAVAVVESFATMPADVCEIVLALLEAGADPNPSRAPGNPGGETTLLMHLMKGNADLVLLGDAASASLVVAVVDAVLSKAS